MHPLDRGEIWPSEQIPSIKVRSGGKRRIMMDVTNNLLSAIWTSFTRLSMFPWRTTKQHKTQQPTVLYTKGLGTGNKSVV